MRVLFAFTSVRQHLYLTNQTCELYEILYEWDGPPPSAFWLVMVFWMTS